MGDGNEKLKGDELTRTLARCLLGTSSALALYRPPQVGKAETISAIEAPSVKHMQEPMNQHHTTCISYPKGGHSASFDLVKLMESEEKEVINRIHVSGSPSNRNIYIWHVNSRS